VPQNVKQKSRRRDDCPSIETAPAGRRDLFYLGAAPDRQKYPVARKVRRGHANLLGGRAIRYELHGFVSAELGDKWQLERMLNHGYLPSIYLGSNPKKN